MDTTGTTQKYSGIPAYSTYSLNVTVANELLEVYKMLISAKKLCFMTFSLFCHCYKCEKWDMLYIFLMWIPHYIDMNRHLAKTY